MLHYVYPNKSQERQIAFKENYTQLVLFVKGYSDDVNLVFTNPSEVLLYEIHLNLGHLNY